MVEFKDEERRVIIHNPDEYPNLLVLIKRVNVYKFQQQNGNNHHDDVGGGVRQ